MVTKVNGASGGALRRYQVRIVFISLFLGGTGMSFRFAAILFTAAMILAPATDVAATQFVYLDFDSGTSANVNYTPTMRTQIVDGIQAIYGDFDIIVQDTIPSGPYSQITFNSGFSGGVAEQIDFRNLDNTDSAVVNVTGLGLSTSQYTGASTNIGAHELGTSWACATAIPLDRSAMDSGHPAQAPEVICPATPAPGQQLKSRIPSWGRLPWAYRSA